MGAQVEWPESLTGTPTVAVLENAIARQRLSHSILLHGDDLGILAQVALVIADRLLNTPRSTAQFPPENHPDCFTLRPTGKIRQISAETTRDLIGKVQVSANVAERKVAIIHECDRMHLSAANIFLKTLEEPPANTTLLLLTNRPYALLPTIRSRVLHFRFPSLTAPVTHPGWQSWIGDYQAWLAALSSGVSGKPDVAAHIFTLYGLIARFSAILDAATAEVWKQEKPGLPPEITSDEQVAIETGIANGIRTRLFAGIEHATRGFAVDRLRRRDAACSTAFVRAIRQLEHDVGLLRLNLNEAAALEDFLLGSLRIWSRR